MTAASESERQAESQIGPLTLADLKAEHFRPFVGQILTFANPAGVEFRMELLEVNEKAARSARMRVPFSLLFSLLGDQPLTGGLLAPQVDGFAREGWLIERVSVLGGEAGLAYCEAVFA